MLILLALAATPKLRVCTGTVCAKYGAHSVLTAAQGLASAGGAEVFTSGCLNVCSSRTHMAVATKLNGADLVLDACERQPQLALSLAADTCVR